MARRYQLNEIFIPGAFPEHTYVTRNFEGNITYEKHLEWSLDTLGFLTSIVGPSKTGKTVLCEKVIHEDRMLQLSGVDFKSGEDFWVTLAKKLGIPLEIETSDSSGDEWQGGIKGRGNLGIIGGEGSSSYKKVSSQTNKEKKLTGKDLVIETLTASNRVLILDDFHYAPPAIQLQIAQQLKDAIRKGLKAVVISLPHRADDTIRENPDLNARMNFIDIEPWSDEELEKIPVIGFAKLGVEIPDNIAERLARESITSPQLMQNICLNLGRLLDVDHDETVTEIADEGVLEEAFKRTTLNMAYRNVVKALEAGPPSRGQIRKTYELLSGKAADIYGAILQAISEDPPIISISVEELRKRVNQIMVKPAKVERKNLIEALKQIQKIIDQNGQLYKVLEVRDDEIYILDPYFLFFLRWGR